MSNTTDSNEALKPCPFCGSSHIVSSSSLYPFSLYCRSCFAHGPREGSETLGQKWNTRRASVAAVEGDVRCEVSYTGRHRIDAPYCKDCGQVFTPLAAASSPLPAEETGP